MVDTHPEAALGIVGLAYATSLMPDRLECLGFKHRGATHWPESGLVVAAVCGLLAAQWTTFGLLVSLGVLVGYMSHLAADACTVSGIPLGPVFRRLFRRRTRNGGWLMRQRVWLLPRSLRINTHPRR